MFYFDTRGIRDPKPTLDNLPSELITDLAKLFDNDNGAMNPLGLASWRDDGLTDWCAGMTYDQLYAMAQALVATQSSAAQGASSNSAWSEVFRTLAVAADRIKAHLGKRSQNRSEMDERRPLRRFFVSSDKEFVQAFRNTLPELIGSLEKIEVSDKRSFSQLSQHTLAVVIDRLPLLEDRDIRMISSGNSSLEWPLRDFRSLISQWKDTVGKIENPDAVEGQQM